MHEIHTNHNTLKHINDVKNMNLHKYLMYKQKIRTQHFIYIKFIKKWTIRIQFSELTNHIHHCPCTT